MPLTPEEELEYQRLKAEERDLAPKPNPKMGAGEALWMGWSQGASLGTMDEIAGAVDAVYRKYGLDALPTWLGGLPEHVQNPYADKSLKELYTTSRDVERKRLAKARTDEQGLTTLGEIAGGFAAGMLAPGSAAKNASLLGRAKSLAPGLAAEGAVLGLGTSEAGLQADGEMDLTGLTSDAAIDSLINVGGGVLFSSLFKAGSDVIRGRPNAVKEAVTGGDPKNGEDLLRWVDFRAESEREMSTFVKGMVNDREFDPGRILNDDTALPYLQSYNIDMKAIEKNLKERDIVPRDADTFKPTYVLRGIQNDIKGYMEFVARTGTARNNRTSWDVYRDQLMQPDWSKKHQAEVTEQFLKAQRQGQVNADTYEAYKTEQYFSEAIQHQNHRAILKATGEQSIDDLPDDELERRLTEVNKIRSRNDPLSGQQRRFMDANIAFRMVDERAGTDIESIQGMAYQAGNRKTGFDRILLTAVTKARRQARKEGIEPAQLRAMIEDPDSASTAVTMYRDAFRLLRTMSNDAGLTVEDLGETYVPMRKKSGADLILALEKKADDVGLDDMPAHKNIADLLGREVDWDDPEVESILGALPGGRRDLALFSHYLGRHLSIEMTTIGDLKQGVKELRGNFSLSASMNPEVGATFQRKGLVPDWIREDNVDRLIMTNIDQASRAAFLRPVSKAFEARISVLQSLGMTDAATYVSNYKMDLVGAYRENAVNTMGLLRMKYDLWSHNKGTVDTLAPQVWDTMKTAIYPNMIGFNLRSVLRNLTQPWTMTVPEVGWIQGSKYAFGAYKDLAATFTTGGWKKMLHEVENVYHLKPIEMRPEDFEGIRRGVHDGLKKGGMEATQRVIDTYSRVSMAMFTGTDAINRAVTLQMAKRMATEMVQPGPMSNKLKAGIELLPRAVRSQIDIIQSKGMTPADAQHELTTVLGRHYVISTQLAYGKVGMHELGRDIGPMMSMLTKWPVAITSDIHYKIWLNGWEKGGAQVLSKYFAPLAVASGLTAAVIPEDHPAGEMLVGKRGFQAWLPVHSAFQISDIFVPVNVESPVTMAKAMVDLTGEAIAGEFDAYDMRQLKRTGARATQQYVSVAGGLWHAYDELILPWTKHHKQYY